MTSDEDPAIERALAADPDYSPAFTERVVRLAEAMAAETGLHPVHSDNGNYNVGAFLTLHLDAKGNETANAPGARYALTVAVSSKGPLYTLLLADRDGNGFYAAPFAEDLPFRTLVAQLRAFLREAGLLEVPQERLEEMVPGHLTELDGAPATLRDVLFCELC